MVGLIDLFDQRATGALAKEAERQPEHVTKGGADQIGFNPIGHGCTQIIGGQGEKTCAYARQEQQGDHPQQRREHLRDCTRSDVVRTVGFTRVMNTTLQTGRVWGTVSRWASGRVRPCQCLFGCAPHKDS